MSVLETRAQISRPRGVLLMFVEPRRMRTKRREISTLARVTVRKTLYCVQRMMKTFRLV